jgi:uncharacterized lipoprotein YddW (UPF0748 family)
MLAFMARSTSLFALALAASLASACAVEADDDMNGSVPARQEDGPVRAAPKPGEVHPDGSVVVAHDRELRGAWISTVWNGTWPSKTGLAPEVAKAELVSILDALAGARMNAVFFQVRAEGDAVYESTLEPWSRFLTGTQGKDPGWDPLAFAIEEGHRRGLEVHAWMNPYRAMTSKDVAPASNHVTKKLPGATRTYGNLLWMDPGAPEVRAHILEVVRDILRRYDVDGIHFDDYFYPYPVSGQTFDDSKTYAAYTTAGGTLGKDDWRRSNVDALVRETAEVVASMRPDVRFGISPFGIYRPGNPPGIKGLDAYATLYCDPVRWMNEGWVDYLAPQLYWPTTQTAQAFGKLLDWWAGISKDGRWIFVGHDATKAGEGAFSVDEYDAQMKLARSHRDRNVAGSIFFSAAPLVSDKANLRTMLTTKYWSADVATPPLASARDLPPGPPPAVALEGDELTVATSEDVRSVAIYRREGESITLERLVPKAGAETHATLEPGQWLVSTIDRRGVETRGAPITAP